MARFEFFDSYVTGTQSYTYSTSASDTQVELDYCGESNSGDYTVSYSFSGGSSHKDEAGFLSSSGQSVGVTQSLSRDNATNATYSFTVSATDSTVTGTGSENLKTLRTTGTTTQTIGARQTTTTAVSAHPFSGSFLWRLGGATTTVTPEMDARNFYNRNGMLYEPDGGNFSAPISFGSTTQSTAITLTISTTLTGYVFCQVLRDAAFLYTLDPYGASSRANSVLLTQHPRAVPAYWATTPLSEGTSFSATGTAGTHQVFSTSAIYWFTDESGAGVNDIFCDPEQTVYGGAETTASGYSETKVAWKTYETQTFNPINQYQRKRLSTYYYIDPLADPKAAPIYTSYTLNNSTLALSITANSYDLFVVVSQHAGNNCYTPAYFTGIRPGTTGVKTGVSTTATRRVNVSWLSTSAIGFTAKTSTASTDTVSSQVGFMKSSAQTSDYVTVTEAMDIYFPPYVFRTGTEFEPVASYGVSAGTYKLASTNSTGGTSSQTSSGIVSSTVPSSVYGRPHRKIAYSYAITTSSGTLTGSDGYLVNEYTWQPGGQAVFTSLYGGIAGYGRADVSVEESRGDNLGSRRVF